MTSTNIKIQSKNKKAFVFTETTGAYSPNNLGGWGVPNETIGDATAASLKIYDKNNILIATIDMLAGLPDPNNYTVTNTFPNDSYQATAFNFYQGQIDNTLLGYLPTEIIPDGVYTFVYEVTTSTETYTKVKYHFHYCSVECCVEKAFAKIPETSCICDDSLFYKAKRMKTYLIALKYASECFQKERFERLLRILQNICSGNQCNCD